MRRLLVSSLLAILAAGPAVAQVKALQPCALDGLDCGGGSGITSATCTPPLLCAITGGALSASVDSTADLSVHGISITNGWNGQIHFPNGTSVIEGNGGSFLQFVVDGAAAWNILNGAYWPEHQGYLVPSIDAAEGIGTPASRLASVTTKCTTVQSDSGATSLSCTSEEITTLAAAAYTDTAMSLPALAVIGSVTGRVLTTVPTASTFAVGSPTVTTRFVSGVSTTAGTTFVGLSHFDQSGAGGPVQQATAHLRITPDATPATATGQVKLVVFWTQFSAPPS